MPDPREAAVESYLPLKPVVFYILLALAERQSHAYGVIQAVRELSAGLIRLETGPFYRHLRKLLDGGLVQESAERPPDDDRRRGAYYRLTRRGREVVTAESRRLAGLVARTEQMGLLPEEGAG